MCKEKEGHLPKSFAGYREDHLTCWEVAGPVGSACRWHNWFGREAIALPGAWSVHLSERGLF